MQNKFYRRVCREISLRITLTIQPPDIKAVMIVIRLGNSLEMKENHILKSFFLLQSTNQCIICITIYGFNKTIFMNCIGGKNQAVSYS